MSAGYIKLHRVLQDNPAWTSEPFTRSQAWVDMLLSASYKPHSVRIRGIKIDLERGQLALSEVEYAKRWKWSRGKVNRFLSELESKTVQQIVQQKTNVTTLVTILNYDRYQGDDTADSTANGQQTGSRRAADGHIQEGKEREEGKERKEGTLALNERSTGVDHVLNTKQPKPSKTAYGEFKNVTLTEAEHKKLLGGHGASRLSKAIAELDDYIESSGKRYKSHYAVLKPTGWVWKKLDEAKASTGPKATNGSDYFQPNG